MPIEIVVTTDRYQSDPGARTIIDFIRKNDRQLLLEDATLYYDFPSYTDYDSEIIRPDILILSPTHGFIAIKIVSDGEAQAPNFAIESIDDSLSDFTSNLYARLLKSRDLRLSRTKSMIDVNPVIYDLRSKRADATAFEAESAFCSSTEGFLSTIRGFKIEPLADKLIQEARSVVEGAKALTRSQKRITPDPDRHPLAAALAKLESEIANFDQKQRHVALVDAGGPTRIRGLAGSGKTVILAMKVAHLHLNKPQSRILITFFTRSLRATIKTLITRFYRHYAESDPDWSYIHIRHGWGGRTSPGVYSDACKRQNVPALNLQEAQRAAAGHQNAFAAACADLLSKANVTPFYDYTLIDEGQDFPPSFYRLCFFLTKGERDRKNIIWAYDELQDIMKIKIRQPDELFGIDADHKPRISLDRSASHLPPGATNDAILSKCYRNQRDVLVTAHALGFGVYGNIVQLLESKEHWQDVGYDVLSGPLTTGENVHIVRPDYNSPVTIQTTDGFPLVDWYRADNLPSEVDWVVDSIKEFIDRGVGAEDIIVIALDDRNARGYLKRISSDLALAEISTNNIIADPYNEPPFNIPGKVTLSTVYRAKGNEAAVVFAVGVDAVDTASRDGRNKLFTAFSRSKAWLRISGTGDDARTIIGELKKATALAPEIKFVMPDLEKIETIQRGLSRKQARAKAARDEYIRKLKLAGLTEEEIEEELSAGGEK
ncbi:ATP-binding domain-containing protein [Constrictibacter sp. MBR-5]|jgi:superfamily I DNA and RNA helicase|uniref:DEAD/DEAH box helicase n=1 Tax=Constrictibacter sp. MBR-5 TaxID=3156467 RepID=UPI003393B006